MVLCFLAGKEEPRFLLQVQTTPFPWHEGRPVLALHGDTVELQALPPKTSSLGEGTRPNPKSFATRLKELPNEEPMNFLAISKKDLGRLLITAENARLFIPFKILGDARNAQAEDKVVAKFVRWDPPARIPTCKIIRVLGPGGDPQTDHLGILAKFGLSSSFPKKSKTKPVQFLKKSMRKTCKNAWIIVRFLPLRSTLWMPEISTTLFPCRN